VDLNAAVPTINPDEEAAKPVSRDVIKLR